MGKLKHKSKNFCQKLCDQFDGPAKNAAGRWLTAQGFEVQGNPDKYGTDLFAVCNNPTLDFGEPWIFEVQTEVKNNWADGSKTFPFREVDLPGRRAESLKNPNTIFLIFSKDLKGVLIVYSGHQVAAIEVVKTPRNTKTKESFLRISQFIEKRKSSYNDSLPAGEWNFVEF